MVSRGASGEKTDCLFYSLIPGCDLSWFPFFQHSCPVELAPGPRTTAYCQLCVTRSLRALNFDWLWSVSENGNTEHRQWEPLSLKCWTFKNICVLPVDGALKCWRTMRNVMFYLPDTGWCDVMHTWITRAPWWVVYKISLGVFSDYGCCSQLREMAMVMVARHKI